MAKPLRPRVQLDMSTEVRDRAKAVAYDRGLTLVEFVLQCMDAAGKDKKLSALINKELATKPGPGRPLR